MKFIVTVAIEHSGDPAEADAMLDGFLATTTGSACVGEDLAERTIDVTFGVDAATADEAFEAARPIFAAGLTAAGIAPRPIVGFHIEPSRETAATEPQPA